MRILRVFVSADRRDEALQALDEREMSAMVTRVEERDGVLVEVPLPSNAIGNALEALESAGVDTGEYTVVMAGEASMTRTSQTLERRYGGKYQPLTGIELRSKARDLSQDPVAFSALMILSAVIAAAGLLVNSPAIVVGSMVIAPIVGPALTASVGAVIGDRRMIVASFELQTLGLVLAVVAAATVAGVARLTGIVPPTLDLPALDLFGVRLAPNALSVLVGLAAGAAAGFGLTTKGPTSIIGVMIAAALIPTAAATGIAIAWLEVELVIGTAMLLVVTLVAINVAALSVLVGLGYLKRERPTSSQETGRPTGWLLVLLAVVLVLSGTVLVGTAQQLVVDRSVIQATEDTLADPAHENLTAVSVQTQYADMSPFTGPREVTVVVSQSGPADPDRLAADVTERITERTGEEVVVRVRVEEYQYGSSVESPYRDQPLYVPTVGRIIVGSHRYGLV